MGSSTGKRRFLTSAEFAERRCKLADVDAKFPFLTTGFAGVRV
jgi:hypothetical protein